MSSPINVLHVEDDFADAMLLQQALWDADAYHYELEAVRTIHDARLKMAKRRFDLIVADLRLPDSSDPHATVAQLEKHAGGAPIVVLTGWSTIDAEKFFPEGQRGPEIKVLDKDTFFRKRDIRKSRELLRCLEGAASKGAQPAPAAPAGRDDDSDTLML